MPSRHTEHSDVSAVVERGTELDLATALFRAVFDSSPIGMLLVDSAGVIRAANRSIGVMFDSTDRWPVGVHAHSVLPVLGHTEGDDDDEVPITGPSALGLTIAHRSDGHSIPVEASMDSVDAEGATFALIYLRDLSGQQEAAHDLADAEAGLYEATQLHDEIIQRMFGAGMQLQAAMALSQTAGVREQIEVAADGLDLAITELREAIARNGGLD